MFRGKCSREEVQLRCNSAKSATKSTLYFALVATLLLERVALPAIKPLGEAELMVCDLCAPRANDVAAPKGRARAEGDGGGAPPAQGRHPARAYRV